MKFKGHELTREELMRAMECETPEELMELVKKIGMEITREEAEAYLETMEELELSPEETEEVAGGKFFPTGQSCDRLKKINDALSY